jgi:flagellar motor switch protein FliN
MARTGRQSLGAVLRNGPMRQQRSSRRRLGTNGDQGYPTHVRLPELVETQTVATMPGWSDYAFWQEERQPVEVEPEPLWQPQAEVQELVIEPDLPVADEPVTEDVPEEEGLEARLPSQTEEPPEQASEQPATVPPADEPPVQPAACVVQPAPPEPCRPEADAADQDCNLDLLMQVSVPVTVKMGETSMSMEDLLRLGVGSVIELRKPVSQPVDLCVRGTRFARGEVVVVGNNFGLRITQIAEPRARLQPGEERSEGE